MKLSLKCLLPSCVLATQMLAASVASAEEPAPEGCSELTPAAFTTLVSSLESSIDRASADCQLFCETGVYAAAAQYNLDELRIVLGQVQELQSWLAENALGQPYVTNASAAYNVHGLARDAVQALHHARHWATISAVYHGSSAARLSFDLTTLAIHQLEALGENGGLCYLAAYGPFPN